MDSLKNIYSYSDANLAHSYEWHLPKIKKWFRDHEPKKILEIGCGNGAFGTFCKQNYNVDYYGVDPSHDAIFYCTQQGLENTFNGDPLESPMLKGHNFDTIISIDVIEHVVDLDQFFKGIDTFLAPGGRVFLTTTFHNYLKWLLLAAAGRMDSHVDPLWRGGRIKFFNKKNLVKLFHEKGFSAEIGTGGKRLIPSSFYVCLKKISVWD